MSVAGGLQLVLVSGLAFALVSGAVCSLALPRFLRRIAGWAPAARHRALVLFAFAPGLVAFTAWLSALAPLFVSLIWPELDHCLQHNDGHAHLCAVHLPASAGSALGWGVLGLAATWLVARIAVASRTLRRGAVLSRRLVARASLDPACGAWILPTERPICAAVGFLWPRITLSAGLLAQAPSDAVEAMVAHEEAHVRRRDTLTRLLAGAASLLYWPAARRLVRAQMHLAAEQACDEAAAARIGDRLAVASAILTAERLLAADLTRRMGPLCASFGECAARRVESLLGAPGRPGRVGALSACFVGLLAGLLALSAPLHHMAESLLGPLLH